MAVTTRECHLEVKWKSQLCIMNLKWLSLGCSGMELSRLSLINLVAEFIVWHYWDNARALIRKAGCCHYLRAGTPELCGLKKWPTHTCLVTWQLTNRLHCRWREERKCRDDSLLPGAPCLYRRLLCRFIEPERQWTCQPAKGVGNSEKQLNK